MLAVYEGAGVGLALVRKLVDLLEGSIGVASLVGEGTTFTLWIPMKAQLDATHKSYSEPDNYQSIQQSDKQ